MPQYLSPGVYVEELEAGSRPIEGVATSIAAFVGLAKAGPVNTPTLVTNWSQFTQTFGDFMEESYLAHAVYGYFNNGGGSAYVVRVGADDDGTPAIPSANAELTSGGDKSAPAYKVTAKEPGDAGNNLSVEIEDGPEGSADDVFKLVVKRNNHPEETVRGLHQEGRQERRHCGQPGIEARRSSKNSPRAARSSGRRQAPRSTSVVAALPHHCPPCGSQPRTTSATLPTAPGSPASKRSKRSRCWRFPI